MCEMCDNQDRNDVSESRSPADIIAKAFEEACMSVSVGFGADEMNATIGDAIAHWRHESDLSGARELVYDQSGDAADAIIQALKDAGFVISQNPGA